MTEHADDNIRPARRRRRWPRWLAWSLSLALVALAAVFILAPRVAAPIVRDKLQELVATQLNADLQVGSLIYDFPYGIRARDVSLVSRDQQRVELLRMPEVEVTLARSPFQDGPLVISRLILRRPAIHVIRSAEGFAGQQTLGREPDRAPAEIPPLSRIFELRLVRIEEGQVEYQDHTRPQTVPLVWSGINVELTADPGTSPVYQFQLQARSEPVATLATSGTFDIDDLDLIVDRFLLNATVTPAQSQSPVPAPLQQALLEKGIAGGVQLQATGRFPFRHIAGRSFDARLQLTDARATLDSQNRIDSLAMQARLSTSPLSPAQELVATAQALDAGRVPPASYPTTLPATTLPTTPTGPALLYILVEGLSAYSEDSALTVSRAAFVVDPVEGRWQVLDAAGRAIVGRQIQLFPKPIQAAARGAQLRGAVDLRIHGSGGFRSSESGRQDFLLEVVATSPEVFVTSRQLRATAVQCDLTLSRDMFTVVDDGVTRRGLRAEAYGGTLEASGRVLPGKPLTYNFLSRVHNFDLAAFAADWSDPEEKPLKMSGRGFLKLEFAGASRLPERTMSQSFTGQGEFEVRQGEFYELPAIAEILRAIAPSQEATTVGQAAGLFQVAERQIRFSRIAVSSPILGLQGSGSADFDGQLDLRVVAAPLADWKRNLRKANIPLVGGVAAELAGGIQKLLNTATGKLLYQFKISGVTGKPVVTPEPVPLLTEGVVKIFAEMLKGGESLLEQIR